FFFQAEDGIRDRTVTGVRRVLFRSAERLGQPLSYFVTDRPPQLLTLLRKSAQLAVRAEDPARALDILAEAAGLPATANERADLQRIRGVALSELRQNREALSTLQDAAATAPTDDAEL